MSGILVWITGFSGVGKTSIAEALCGEMRKNKMSVVHVDGDMIRNLFPGLGYTLTDRLENAFRIARICAMLTQQGINVVCSTISMFSEIHEFNKKQNKKCFEVLVNTDHEIVKSRDLRGIYKKNAEIVGVTQEYVLPKNPDLVIFNNIDNKQTEHAEKIFQSIKGKYDI